MNCLVIDLEMNFWNSMNIKKKRAPRLRNSCMQMVVKELPHHCSWNF